MASPKYGVATEWAKHLRPYLKKQHWKKVRVKTKKAIRETNNG
jgi:hypothetical protein